MSYKENETQFLNFTQNTHFARDGFRIVFCETVCIRMNSGAIHETSILCLKTLSQNVYCINQSLSVHFLYYKSFQHVSFDVYKIG